MLQSKTKKKKIKVELYLVRHGFSIANRATSDGDGDTQQVQMQLNQQQQGDFLDIVSVGQVPQQKPKQNVVKKTIKKGFKVLEGDPSLTRTGFEQSKHAAMRVAGINPDHVFTSVLCRAQQTALCMFPTHNVIVAPHLKEKNNVYDMVFPISDNKPFRDIVTQHEKRHNFLPSETLERLVYAKEVLDGSTCLYNHSSINETGSIREFLTKFLTEFLGVQATDRSIKVAVVCHGGIIRDFLGVNKNQTANNVVLKTDVIIDNEILLSVGKPETIFRGFKENKVACDQRFMRQQQKQVYRLNYTTDLSQQAKTYSKQQLLNIYIKQTISTDFGGKQRLQNLARTILTGVNPDESILRFRNRHKNLKTEAQILQYFANNKYELVHLIFQPEKNFKHTFQKIKRFNNLKTDEDVVQYINKNIHKTDSQKQIFNKLFILSTPTPQSIGSGGGASSGGVWKMFSWMSGKK